MNRISSQIPIIGYAIGTSLFMSYTGEEDIFLLTLCFFVMGKLLKQVLDECGNFLDAPGFYSTGAILLNFAYYTVIACVNTTPIFVACALLSFISGYTLQSVRYPKK